MAKSVVHLRLSEGLGNQLFQYAAARALAERLEAHLYIDLAWYELYALLPDQRSYEEIRTLGTSRRCELPHFGLKVDTYKQMPQCVSSAIHTLGRRASNSGHKLTKTIYKKLRKRLYKAHLFTLPLRLKGLGIRYFKEPHHHYTTQWAQLEGNVYIAGFWQSSRYFAQIAPQLREELSLRRFESEKTAPLLQRIDQSGSISLHFRRGDYHIMGWLLPLDYYRRALSLLKALLQGKGSHLYVFSDDVEELLPLLPEVWGDEEPRYTMVSAKGLSAYEEMLLMSRCEHHVMANSSYAWWAAWLHDLSKDPREGQKYTIAPKQWFPTDLGHAASHNMRDFYCDSWILL